MWHLRIKLFLKNNKSSIISCFLVVLFGLGVGLYRRIFQPAPLGFEDITPPLHHPQYALLQQHHASATSSVSESPSTLIFTMADRESHSSSVSLDSQATPPKLKQVHITGAVVSPGVFFVSSNGSVADVVLAAGGALKKADLDSLNLAHPIGEGQKIVVPFKGTGDRPIKITVKTVSQGQGSSDGVLDINTADAAALMSLTGIGPTTAQRIVAYRKTHGPFKSVDSLQEVKGIGPKLLARLRPYIGVGQLIK